MFRKHLLSLIVLLVACSGEVKVRSTSNSEQPSARSLAAPPSDTGVRLWVDTNKTDTLIAYSRWRQVTTLDSVWYKWLIPLPSVKTGLPLAMFNNWNGGVFYSDVLWTDLGYTADNEDTILQRIAYARANGKQIVLHPTGGGRCNYLTPACVKNANGVLMPVSGSKFDIVKWRARLNRFATPTILSAIRQAYLDGVIIAASLIDEPGNVGGPGNEANTWGPPGTFTTAILDGMCREAKNLFGTTMPVGNFQDWSQFVSGAFVGQSYKVCDFITSQYRYAKGSLTYYRDGLLAEAKRQGISIAVSINILDGGTRDTDAVYDCAGTGGLGTYPKNCRMTAKQAQDAFMLLGPVGCYVTAWRRDATFLAKPENKAMFQYVTTAYKGMTRKSCRRPSV
jgi:hypothetical protein